MNVWNIDAGDIREDKAFDNDLLYRTPDIEEFLVAKRDSLFFVIATKGNGKTFVLKAKSINYIRDGIPLIHANILVDKPGAGTVIFNKEKINLFSSIQNWTNLWTLSIYLACIKRLHLSDKIIGYSPLIDETISYPASNITSYFKIILGFSVSDFYAIIEDLNNVVAPFMESINTNLAAFIDNVDEYFETHINQNKHTTQSAVGQTSKDIWYLSQMGLVEAIYQITSKNPHLKIFASIRKEVFIKLTEFDSRSIQYEGCGIELSYTKENIKDIFSLNIDNEKPSRLVYPELQKEKPIHSFIGIDSVTNSYVEGTNESFFDYIYRHTLQRPRDLMLMGRNIARIKPKERTIDFLRKVINDTSTEIAKQYIEEVSPHLDKIDFKRLFKLINSNIISRHKTKEICSSYNKHDCKEVNCMDCDGIHVFGSLYSIGLIGYCSDDLVKGNVTQKFLPPGMKSFDNPNKLPKSNYYLIHPCLYGPIIENNPLFEPSKINIVAPDYNFNEYTKWQKRNPASKIKPSKDKKTLLLPNKKIQTHVHFGAGKLGLGLVIPTFSKTSRVIVIQRPSEFWHQFKNHEQTNLIINGKKCCTFDIIFDKTKNTDLEHLLKKWDSKNNLLICSSDLDLIKVFINIADSISTSLGSGLDYINHLLQNNQLTKPINIYPFENDKHIVDALIESLKSIDHNANVVPVIADKICSYRTAKENNINIECEEYQEVYLYGANKAVFKTCKDLNNVKICTSIQEYNFHRNKKIYIVNGIHMISAIYGYSYLYDKKIPFEEWKNYHLNILLDNSIFLDELYEYVKMQAFRLLIETDENTLQAIYKTTSIKVIYKSLLDYGQLALKRFTQSVDLIVRILNTNDIQKLEDKFIGRIQTLNKIIKNNIDLIDTYDLQEMINSDTFLKVISELNEKTASLFIQILKNTK